MSTIRRTLALVALTGAVAVVVAPGLGNASPQAAAAKPAGFRIAINGRTLTAAQLNAGEETYLPVKVGRNSISVRWVNDLRGSGYSVIVVDNPLSVRRRCTTGTSCSATARGTLTAGAEMYWTVLINKGSRTLSTKSICITGKA
jgi:hypothetical protein